LSEKYCKEYNSTVCTEALLAWADQIFVMESMHVDRIRLYTSIDHLHKIFNLEIPDICPHMDDQLIKKLIDKMPPVLSI
jgi:predicted protein tyrosine phosphatase